MALCEACMEELVLHHLVLQEWSRGAVKSSASKKKKKSVQYHDDIMTESEVGTHQHKVIGIGLFSGCYFGVGCRPG